MDYRFDPGQWKFCQFGWPLISSFFILQLNCSGFFFKKLLFWKNLLSFLKLFFDGVTVKINYPKISLKCYEIMLVLHPQFWLLFLTGKFRGNWRKMWENRNWERVIRKKRKLRESGRVRRVLVCLFLSLNFSRNSLSFHLFLSLLFMNHISFLSLLLSF